jgi:hypothetical protein
VTVAAVGIAALLNANLWWEMAMWGGTLALLATAVLLIIYRRDQWRAFWVGFLVFGGMYLVILVYSFNTNYWDQQTSVSHQLFYSLPTTRLTTIVYQSILPQSRTADQIAGPIVDWGTFNPGSVGPPAATSSTLGLPLATDAIPQPGSAAVAHLAILGPGPVLIPNPNQIPLRHFTNIGQALWLLLIAAVGGKVCQVIYRTRPRVESSAPG